MATQLQIRRGTAAQVAAFTGAEGEIVYNSTNDSLHTNDGATAGGFELARADLNNVLDADLNAALTGNTLSALTITTLTAIGGTINGTVIGGTTAAAGSFTTLSTTGTGTNTVHLTGAGSQDLYTYSDGGGIGWATGTGGSYGEMVYLSDASNDVSFYTAGSLRGKFNSTGLAVTGALTTTGAATFGGKVDINITSSVGTLNIGQIADGDGIFLVAAGAGSGLYMEHNTTGTRFANNAALPMVFETNLVPRLTIDGTTGAATFSGNVSVNGATSPNSSLAILSDSGANAVEIRTRATYNDYAFINFNSTDGSEALGAIGVHRTAAATASLIFYSNDGTAGVNEVGRFDASGNLGLGTTSPVSFGANTNFFTANGTSNGNGYACQVAGTNYGFIYASTNLLTIAAEGASTPIAFATNNATRMVLDTSGNLGLGVTPSADNFFTTLEIGNRGTGLVGRGPADTHFMSGLIWDGNSTHEYTVSSVAVGTYQITNGNHYWGTAPAGTAGTAATPQTNMTLDASGNLLVGKTSSAVTVDGFSIASAASGTTASYSSAGSNTYHVYKTGTGAGYKFYVSYGGTVNYTALSQLSDEREKKNIVEVPHGLNAVMALKPRQFDWRGDEEANGVYGFIAQEVETVLPSLVGEFKKDEGITRKSLSQIELIPILTKAIQEQQAIIEALTARITALEGA
jgi:hypothetical protein